MTDLLDLTPNFQQFRTLAAHATPDERWALWQEHYNFAALPPSPQAKALARQMLDAAWEKYAGLPPDLGAEAQRLLTQEQAVSERLAKLLNAPVPEHKLVAFVGFFDHNPFVAGTILHFPVEMPAAKAEVFMAHELTHLIHLPLSGSTGGWTRSLAALIVQEGLATRSAAALYPDAPLGWQVGEENWLRTCETQRAVLTADALPLLNDSSDETLLRFLQPHPICGMERTAYALGWWLVGEWLAQGRTLSELARIPETDLPELVRLHFTQNQW